MFSLLSMMTTAKKNDESSAQIVHDEPTTPNIQSVDAELMNTSKKTPLMSLEGNTYTAKVVYIYDGDTMHVVFREFGHLFRWNCRVMNVDTPEIRTKNDAEKELGYKVRDILREKFQDKIVTVETHEFDKYGRLLIDIIFDNNGKSTKLSEWLIENEYAYRYGGGTKSNQFKNMK